MSEQCDICSDPNPKWWYHAQPFESLIIGTKENGETITKRYIDEGEWALCDTCKDIVESGDREALVERSMTSPHMPYSAAIGTHAKIVRSMLREFHGEFWDTKISPPDILPKDNAEN
jgi:hypothetical protein